MANSGSDNLTYLPFIFLGVYCLVGGLVFGLWNTRRYLRLRPPSINDDPEAWLSSWFPQLIVGELFALVGAIVTGLLAHFTTGLAHNTNAIYAWLGFGIGFGFLGVFALLFVAVDVAIMRRVRAMSHSVQYPPEAENTPDPR